MKARQTKPGFTLIELLIVIAIIGLLATLAIVSLTSAQQKARDAKRIADVKQLQNAVELYYTDNTIYPISSAAANDTWLEFGTTVSSYLSNMPQDPENSGTKTYTYGTNSTGTAYFIAAELEATNDALGGDDDTTWAVGNMPGLDVVQSINTAPATLATYDCGTSGPDTNLHYCTTN